MQPMPKAQQPATAVCGWDEPFTPLAADVWCGTSLCLPASAAGGSTYGAFNLALHVGDKPSAVQHNRQQLRASLGVGPIQWLEQVHGCEVVAATTDSVNQVPVADAVWTTTPRLPIAVLTADCLPVVLAARDGSCVGVAHGGWRGLVDGVLPALVAALPVPAGQLVAWGGPGIGASAYEVGADVAAAVSAMSGAAAALSPGVSHDKFQLDLHRLAEVSLAACGVMHYRASSRCAFQDSACYSYRRVRGGATGRMATIAMVCGAEMPGDATING